MTFEDWRVKFHETGDICPVRLGCSREDLRALWGEPYDTSVATKGGVPHILKYGDLELHFEPGPSGRLFLISNDEGGVVQVSIRRVAPQSLLTRR